MTWLTVLSTHRLGHRTHSIDASSVGAEVLCDRVGYYCLVIGYTLGVPKDASTRAVYNVCKRSCIIPNVGCEGRFYNVAGTYKIPNYPHALSHTVCGDHNRSDFFRNAVLYLKKRIAAY